MSSSKLKELHAAISRLFHKPRDVPPDRVPPANIPTELANLPERLAYTIATHSRNNIGEAPEMTFLKIGAQDGLYSGVFAFCNCSAEGTSSTPAIRLSTIADKLPEEHIITTPVILTMAGILFNSEIPEDQEWFSLF